MKDKIISICTDSAPNMVAGIEKLIDTRFDDDLIHIRCSAHVLNLAVKEGLSDEFLKESLLKLNYFCKKIHSSSKYQEKMSVQCSAYSEPDLKVKVPVETRWNSDYLMIKTALRIRRSLTFMSSFIINENRKKNEINELNNEDWDKLELVVELLEPFYQGNNVFFFTFFSSYLIIFNF